MSLNRCATRTVAAAIVVAGLTVAAAAIPVESPRDGALAWLRSLAKADRLACASPAWLSQLPVEYRQAVFGSLETPEARTAFWQGVFAQYRRTHALSPEQSAVLSQAEAMLTPALFASRLSDLEAQTLVGVRTAVATALGASAAKELFTTAGPEVSKGARLPFSERMRYLWRRERAERVVAWVGVVVPALQAGPWYCDCNLGGDECNMYQHCNESEYCRPASVGCGSWWWEPCWNKCTY